MKYKKIQVGVLKSRPKLSERILKILTGIEERYKIRGKNILVWNRKNGFAPEFDTKIKRRFNIKHYLVDIYPDIGKNKSFTKKGRALEYAKTIKNVREVFVDKCDGNKLVDIIYHKEF